MNKKEKIKFAREHINFIKKQILESLGKAPNNWAGLEIKQYIGDMFKIPNHWMGKSSRKKYNNDIIVNDL